MLSVAGADHIITIDLHASQIQVGGGRGRGRRGKDGRENCKTEEECLRKGEKVQEGGTL